MKGCSDSIEIQKTKQNRPCGKTARHSKGGRFAEKDGDRPPRMKAAQMCASPTGLRGFESPTFHKIIMPTTGITVGS